MILQTGVRATHKRVYRLIGRDLFSAPTIGPIEEREYALEKEHVVPPGASEARWRVTIKENEVVLEG